MYALLSRRRLQRDICWTCRMPSLRWTLRRTSPCHCGWDSRGPGACPQTSSVCRRVCDGPISRTVLWTRRWGLRRAVQGLGMDTMVRHISHTARLSHVYHRRRDVQEDHPEDKSQEAQHCRPASATGPRGSRSEDAFYHHPGSSNTHAVHRTHCHCFRALQRVHLCSTILHVRSIPSKSPACKLLERC